MMMIGESVDEKGGHPGEEVAEEVLMTTEECSFEL